MKKSAFFIFIFFCISIEMLACICPPRRLTNIQEQEIENSDCIFIGEIIQINQDLTYEIKVIETLDGNDAEGNIYIGKNWRTCVPYVENKGKWIVYANMEDGYLRMNICGVSRPFQNPIIHHDPPPPPDIWEKLSETERKKVLADLKVENFKKAKEGLKVEIETLRKIRANKNAGT